MDAIGRVWDLRTGKSIMVLQGHVKPIITLDWSPNGYTVATGSEDNTIRIWDVRQAKCTYTIPAHKNLVSQVKFWHAGEGFESKGVQDGWSITSDPPYAKTKKAASAKNGDMDGVQFDNGAKTEDEDDEDDPMEEDDDIDMDPAGHRDDRDDNISMRKQLLTGAHLVSSSYDGTCRIFSEGDWKPIKSLSGLEGKVMCCDVSKGWFVNGFDKTHPSNTQNHIDGKFIATASYDRTFKLFASDNLVI
jgi:U4/U6 small nuclear ribonucleoprotein PRP4